MGIKSASTTQKVKSENLRLEDKTRFEKPKQVMLLSNTQDLGRIIQLSLEVIASWQVTIVTLSPRSIAIAETYQPDVLLLDTVLPDLSEMAMLQMIQANFLLKNIPLILLTERMQSNDYRLYASLHVVAAIAKPFDMLELVELIDRCS